MTTVVTTAPRDTYDSYDSVAPPTVTRRVSWGAIFAGSVIGLALIILFTLLGVGIGAATIDPASGQTPDAGGAVTGSVIYFAVVQLVALLIGGFAAARLAGVPRTMSSMLHGAAVWSVATFAMFWLATTAIGTIAGGLASTLSQAGQGVASAAKAVIPDNLSLGDLANVDTESLPPELRRTLERNGLTVDNVREETVAAFRDVVSKQEQSQAESVVTDTAKDIAQSPGDAGQDLQAMVDKLVGGPNAVLSDEDKQQALQQMQERLGISQEEAQQLVDQAQQQIQQAQAEVEQAVEKAKTEAAQAAETAANAVSGAAFGAFVASLLGLIAAVVGALIGRPKETLDDTATTRTTARV